MAPTDSLPATFITKAADVLGDTQEGLSGSQIVQMSVDFGLEYDVDVPHATYPFGPDVPNKRTALRDNLLAFSGSQQYAILKHLCDLDWMKNRAGVEKLRLLLVTRYGSLDTAGEPGQLDEALIEETRHWLDRFPKSLGLYERAMEKRRIGSLTRGLLDDLRLALELLLKDVLGNDKSLEKQLSALGNLVQTSRGSRELQNMFVTLIDYYTKYQNTYIKHDDAVVEVEVVIVTELTSAFMRHVVRLDVLSRPD